MSLNSTPILELPDGVIIRSMITGPDGVLLGLSDGRILLMDSIYGNAYLTGPRSLYVQIQNIYGQVTEIGWSNLMYRMSNQIVKINDRRVTETYRVPIPIAATQSSEVSGVFTTPILFGGTDFGFWGRLIYDQTVPDGTRVVVGVRGGSSEKAVADSAWTYFEYSGSTINQDLSWLNLSGAYVQAQVQLISAVVNLTPQVSQLTLGYQTKYAVYLFSRLFTLDSKTNLQSAIVTATVSAPPHSEIRFGISGKDTANWNDYTVFNFDQSFNLPSSVKDQFKIGMKFTTTSTEAPTLGGFALMLSGDVDNQINQLYQSSSSSSS